MGAGVVQCNVLSYLFTIQRSTHKTAKTIFADKFVLVVRLGTLLAKLVKTDRHFCQLEYWRRRILIEET